VLNKNRLVMEVDGQVVSTASTNGLGLKSFQILGVVTRADVRRRGYARAACAALMRRMQAQGAEHCVLFTNETNTAARRCYESLGFRVTGDFCVARLRPCAASGA
jgi:uncharacterized protein